MQQTQPTTPIVTLPGNPAELDEFRGRIRQYLDGSLSADDFKKCRLQLGIYGIRALRDRQMVRIKVPGGWLNAGQCERVAALAEAYATGRAHVTTRQDFQLYEVPLPRVPDLLAELADVGLTTREACGNSVRNITACPFTGLCPDEVFDVAPYVLAATTYFLRHPDTQELPRKFKMSFSGCRHDRAMAAIHDIGVIAALDQGRPGFRLYVGGGLGALPRPADLLEPWTPLAELLPTMEAVLAVFNRDGERKNRQRARMKFLLSSIGIEEFRRRVFARRDELHARPERFPLLPEPAIPTNGRGGGRAIRAEGAAGYVRWVKTNAQPQRQPGVAMVTVRLLLGDLSVPQLRGLADAARRFSGGRVVTTPWQDVCLPWVREEDLPSLYAVLVPLGLGRADAERIQDITSCPGADTCQIGITASRGLATALADTLDAPEYKTDDLQALRIKLSGCPNSCGQHHIADIGMFGSSRNVAGRPVPFYQVLVGGGCGDGEASFGQTVARLPARRVPQAVEALLAWYRRERTDGESFRACVERAGTAPIERALAPFAVFEPNPEDPEAFRDWGHTEDFSLGGMGKGECAG
ncbi:MAG TPA: nitrite/sulfite reductase [bacterium]